MYFINDIIDLYSINFFLYTHHNKILDPPLDIMYILYFKLTN